MPVFEHNNLFNETGPQSTLDYLQSRLAERDLSPAEALAMLSAVHEELNNPAKVDRGVYQQYSRFMEALRTEMPEVHSYVVSAWEQRGENRVKADKTDERDDDSLEAVETFVSRDPGTIPKSGAESSNDGDAAPEEQGGEDEDGPEAEEKSEEADESEVDAAEVDESGDSEGVDKGSEKDEEKEDEQESVKEEKEEGREESEADESEKVEEKDIEDEAGKGEETEEEEKESGEEGGEESEEGSEEPEPAEVIESSEEGVAESGSGEEPELPETNDVETEPFEEADGGDAAAFE